MALRFVFLLLCTICIIGLGVALPPPPTKECGRNSERQQCGSACPPTCTNPTPGPTCVLPCVNDCFCKSGYLKAANGQCVLPEECDSIPHIPGQQIPNFNGALDENPKCGENEEYRTCGPACPSTCTMPLPKPWCTRHCAVGGCFCKDGYLKNEENICIHAKKCILAKSSGPINIPLHRVPDPQCPTDEEYSTCGFQLDCLARCKIELTPKCMERQCIPGCVCRQPLVRHENGRCIEKPRCPKT